MKSWIVSFSFLGFIGLGLTQADPGKTANSFHFTYDIAPHLAREGCAAADCHGGATGRGGFKLSLFATDPAADYEAITRELGGRRVDLLHPENSLVLKKPSRQVKHGGGRVIRSDGPAYGILRNWIARGAPFAEGPRERLCDLSLEHADDGSLRVHATFAGEPELASSRVRDVTGLARFESTNPRVADVDRDGRVQRTGPGEAWILARYGHLIERIPMRQRFSAGDVAEDATHPLDRAWLARLALLGIRPAPPASDTTVLRRLAFDLAGRPPSPREVEVFRSLPTVRRVPEMAERYLGEPEFVEVFSRHLWRWMELPMPRDDLERNRNRNAAMRSFLGAFVAEDRPLVELVPRLFTESAGMRLLQRFEDPRDRAEFFGRSLLGLSIGCARCHNHPHDRWTQIQHLQFSAFFTDQRPSADRAGVMEPGKFFLPGDGYPVKPVLLPMTGHAPPEGTTRAEQLEWLVTRGGRRQFARNVANRVFGVLLGKHLVEAPDDHRRSNPAVHEPLLDLLADAFLDSGTRLRELARLVVTSRLYRTASEPPDAGNLSGDPAWNYLARRDARPLSPELYRRALMHVLGVELPAGRMPESPLAQQLHILNGGLIEAGLDVPGNQVEAIFDFQTDPDRQLDELYLLVLSREPRESERERFVPLFQGQSPAAARSAGKDLAWALLAGREFSSLR